MLSSTSSSNQRLPAAEWTKVLLGGTLLALAFIAVMELRLAARGIRPTTADTIAAWVKQRARASALGKDALILVGDSRMHTNIDLGTLRALTGLEPVQLAMDGSSFAPVLDGLARDPKVTGTVVVSFLPYTVSEWGADNIATDYEAYYERESARWHINAQASEEILSGWVGAHMRSYADGAAPLNSLLRRILTAHPLPQYVVTLPDRSKLADFALATMPELYYERVAREMRVDIAEAHTTAPAGIEAFLAAKVAALQPVDAQTFDSHLGDIEKMVAAIERRGGKVYFVELPTAGLVRTIGERSYPRAAFWDAFAKSTTASAVTFRDVPALQAFPLPDGSHLDYRLRPPFTQALVAALGLAAQPQSAAPD